MALAGSSLVVQWSAEGGICLGEDGAAFVCN
jgi:hypothetical protein